MKPILFNTEMVRAILDGRKTVTRRIIKDVPQINDLKPYKPWGDKWAFIRNSNSRVYDIRNPYKTGDILYVRETWSMISEWTEVDPSVGMFDGYIYRADWADDSHPRWYPSIHMPKEAARIFLRVTDVRVERLQDIDVDGCRAEGIWDDYKASSEKYHEALITMAYPKVFSELWDSTIKPADRDKYGWDANPWVFVLSFVKITKEEAQHDD